MPSTLVHVAVAGLVACALLREAFSTRAVAAVVGAVVLVDFDVFVGWFVLGAHRAAFHTLLVPAALTVALAYDVRVADRSRLVDRFGETAPRIGGVTVTAVVVAGVLPDLVTNGVNLLWPVHDQFYALNGEAKFSDRKGLIQTFVEGSSKGTTEETQFRTGADPEPDRADAAEQIADAATGDGGDGGTTETEPQEPPPERVFLLVNSGLELLLVGAGTVLTSFRLWEHRRS